MIDGQTLHLTTAELLGLAGAALYAGGYLLAAYDRLPSQSPLYYLTKLVAAGLVLFSLTESFNLAAAVIQVFFVVISLIGIFRHLGAWRQRRAYRDAIRSSVDPSAEIVVRFETRRDDQAPTVTRVGGDTRGSPEAEIVSLDRLSV